MTPSMDKRSRVGHNTCVYKLIDIPTVQAGHKLHQHAAHTSDTSACPPSLPCFHLEELSKIYLVVTIFVVPLNRLLHLVSCSRFTGMLPS